MRGERMKSKWKRIVAIGIIVLLAANGIFYYVYVVDKDKNGLSRRDVARAQKTLQAYITSMNQRDVSGSLSYLSEYYADELESWRKSYELGSGIVLEDFHAEYNRELNCQQLEYVRGAERQFAGYKPEAKMIYFSCSFYVVERQTGSALGSGLEAGASYEEYGYWLIQENGKWKIFANGY